MSKHIIKKATYFNMRFMVRFFGVCICLIGVGLTAYVFTPLLLWQLFLSPAIASSHIVAPIPQTTLVSKTGVQSLFAAQMHALEGTDYTDAKNWFPTYTSGNSVARVPFYSITIPKLHITNAVVATNDTDLAHHLVHLQGTSIPPDLGNAVIFGHSTLPQLFNPSNYKTIFANALLLNIGDVISVNVENITYMYKIVAITVIDPEDTSVLAQTLNDRYLTLITCTPPGTIWKRLVIKSRLQTL